jgi:hypothetical protein
MIDYICPHFSSATSVIIVFGVEKLAWKRIVASQPSGSVHVPFDRREGNKFVFLSSFK